MKKLYSTIMMLAMMVAALSLTACGGDDDEGGGDNSGGNGNKPNNTLTIVNSNGDKYISLASVGWTSADDAINGYLTERGTIFCFMVKEGTSNAEYLHIYLKNGENSISDFPVGYDMDEPSLTFGITNTNKFHHVSGDVKVIRNDGKGFTLEFNDYKAQRSSGYEITLNGTLYVEKEVYG